MPCSRRAKPCFDDEVTVILARLRRSRMVFLLTRPTVRIDGRTHWNWVFQHNQLVVDLIRNSRAASVVTDVLPGHRPTVQICRPCGARKNKPDLWRIYLAYEVNYSALIAMKAGDVMFARFIEALLLRTVSFWHRRKPG